jgi:hypothetical protein
MQVQRAGEVSAEIESAQEPGVKGGGEVLARLFSRYTRHLYRSLACSAHMKMPKTLAGWVTGGDPLLQVVRRPVAGFHLAE